MREFTFSGILERTHRECLRCVWRQCAPGWLLLEALDAHTEGNQRILEQLAVLGAFGDSQSAMKRYAQLHHVAPAREFYVFHTSRETLDVIERRWYGIRAAQ